MIKIKLIIVYVFLTIKLSLPISLYSVISDTEPTGDNRLPKKLQPVELMVDATNHLGIKILNLHSHSNKNNIAFSPCGLMSILVALYEGSSGKSNVEIKEALGFPNERDIVRVGVRDIHRRLRSYFYRKENLLNGLIFNKENITIKQEYENILRFYGYDIDTTPNMVTESKINMEEPEKNKDESNGLPTENNNSTSTTTTTEVPSPSSTVKEDETTILEETTETEGTTKSPEEIETTDTTNTEPEEAVTEAVAAETETPPTRKRAAKSRGLRVKKDKQHFSLAFKNSRETNRRQSRSFDIFGGEPYEFDLRYEGPLSTRLPPLTSPIPPIYPEIKSPSLPSNLPALSNKFLNKNDKLIFDNLNSDTIDHIFYLNEYETVRVPFKIYDTVMKYAYDSSLHAHILEIDLDTEHYDLIVIMPDYQYGGLNDVVKRLQAQEPKKLRKTRQSLDYVWVKTIVPKFNLNGHTIITSDLQNMGISDIFEPSKADFSLLADDKSIYVRNVEQTININIRTQTTQQLKKISSLYKEPVEIPINCPFLFSVVDKELDLEIIMGRIINPLNSRIQ